MTAWSRWVFGPIGRLVTGVIEAAVALVLIVVGAIVLSNGGVGGIVGIVFGIVIAALACFNLWAFTTIRLARARVADATASQDPSEPPSTLDG